MGTIDQIATLVGEKLPMCGKPEERVIVLLVVRPSRYVPVIAATLAFVCYPMVIWSAYGDSRDAWQYVVLTVVLGLWLAGCAYLMWWHSLEVHDAFLRERRFFGLGDRTIPFAAIAGVRLLPSRSALGRFPIPMLEIESTAGQTIKLGTNVYSERDLKELVSRFRQSGVPLDHLARNWSGDRCP